MKWITIGGLYGTVDEVDTERKTVVLDVDGVYLTFELTAIKTVLPVSEGVTAGAVEGAGDSDSIIDGEIIRKSDQKVAFFIFS